MKDGQVKTMVKTAMMMAIVFIFTYTFKIPVSITNGYTHLGDCAIFLSVILLGRKNGMIAGAFGAALSDLLGGYVFWIIPTFIIKAAMAFVMGTFVEKWMPKHSLNWLIGAIVGGLVQIFGYTAVKVPMIGFKPAMLTIPEITLQTVVGIIIASVIIVVLKQGNVLNTLKNSAAEDK